MTDRFQHLYVYGLRFVDPLSRDAADDADMIVSDNENIRRIIREAETAEHFLSDSRYWTVPGFRLIYGQPVRNDARLSLTDGGTRFV